MSTGGTAGRGSAAGRGMSSGAARSASGGNGSNTVVVGVDLGSSGVRAVALSRDGQVRAWTRQRFDGTGAWPPGRADPEAWLAGLGRALGDVGEGFDIAAVGVGGQSPTTVPMSHEPAVTCQHPAGNGLDRIGQHLAQREFLEDELGRQIAPAQSWDWALRRLGAGDVQGLWSDEDPIPGYGQPVGVGAVIGHADGSCGLAAGTPLVSGSNDAYMSFWAGGLGTPGRGHDPGGRTGGVGVAVAAADRPPEVVGFHGIVAGVEVVGGPVNGHGELLEWWSALSGLSIGDLLERAAAVPPGAGGVLVLPYHDGERAPRWEPRLRGEVHGLTFKSGAAEVARAALEAAAYGLRHICEGLAEAGIALEVLGTGGSPALSRLWGRIKASVLEVPVEAPERPDQLSARGCALAAGAAVGWWDGIGAADMDSWPLPAMARIDPEPDPAYRDAYRRFVEAGDAAVARLAKS